MPLGFNPFWILGQADHNNHSSPEFFVTEGSNNLRLVRQEQQVVQRNVQQLVQKLVELNGLHEDGNYQLTDVSPNQSALSPKRRQKQDALDLAELIYDVFVASEASDKMSKKG